MKDITMADVMVWLAVSVLGVAAVVGGCEPAHAVVGLEEVVCVHEPMLRQLEADYELPPGILVTIARAESSCRADAVGEGGERGLMQVSEEAWTRFSQVSWSAATTLPEQNARVAAVYLKLRRSNDPRALVAWYNAGVREWEGLNPRWSVHHPNRVYRRVYVTGRLE